MTYNEQKIQEEFRKMKATGIVRRIDDLGRVVIPKEIRKTLRIKEGTPLEIFTDREGQIILKKYSPIGELNTFAAEYAEALVQTTGLTACITDRDQVVAACGSGSRELEGKEISSELDAIIAGRKGRMVSQDSRENISVISDAMDSFCQKMIQPILCASDAIGAVILLTKSEKTALGDTERALIRTAAGFLGSKSASDVQKNVCRSRYKHQMQMPGAADQGGCGHREGKQWYSSRVRFVIVSQEARGFVT